LEGTEKRHWELADQRGNTGVNYRAELRGDTGQVELPG